MYQYNAIIRDVHDGDTYTLDIDLGLCCWLLSQKLRLAHANAPELNTPEGVASRAYVAELLPAGSRVVIDTVKSTGDKEKFGRWLMAVTLPDGTDLATRMIADHQAVPYEGGPR